MLSKQGGMEDPEQKEFDLKVNKTIEDLPEEIRDRFKALKVIQDENNLIDDEDEQLQKDLDMKYEDSYKPTYDTRQQILSGKLEIPADLLAAFDKRAEELNDEEFKALDVEMCDVTGIQNSPDGIPGFWLKVLLNSRDTQEHVFEKDRSIL